MNIEEVSASLEKRFYEKIQVNLLDIHGCILWKASTCDGYGQISDGRSKNFKAHIISYVLHYGKSPKGRYMQIDHTCRNRACINPYHLRILSQRQNILVGEGSAAKNAKKTHCKNGHEFTPENTYIPQHGVNAGNRYCKICRNNNSKRYNRSIFR